MILLDNLSSDGDVGSERAFLINVCSIDGFLGGLETESNVFVVSDTTGRFLGKKLLVVQEDGILFLERSLNLIKIITTKC